MMGGRIFRGPGPSSQGEWGWKNAAVIGNWLGAEAHPFHSDLQWVCLGHDWRVWGLFPDNAVLNNQGPAQVGQCIILLPIQAALETSFNPSKILSLSPP